jgi:hypothetical protein
MEEEGGEPGQGRLTPEEKRVARELIEILNELRIALPGVQVMFAFLVTVPFSAHFDRLGPVERGVLFAAFACALISSAMLIAPSVYHRLRWHRRVEEKERMLRTFTSLAIGGSVFLGASYACAAYVLTSYLFGVRAGVAVAVASALLIAGLWYGLPLSRRYQEHP